MDRFLKNYEEASIAFDEAVAEGLTPEKEVLQKMFSLKGFKTAVFSTVFNCQGIIDALSLYVEGLPTHIPNTLRGITTLDKSLSEQTFKLEDLKRDCYAGFDQLNAMFHSPGVKAAVTSDLALGSIYGKDIRKAIIRKIMEKAFFMKDKRGLREVLRAVWTAGEKIKWDR